MGGVPGGTPMECGHHQAQNWTPTVQVSWHRSAMRADRLVAILLLLQARGKLTAPQLAAELEVSEKTARRDLEALSIAGIPLYAQPGRGGGWRLLGGARTDLSGLTAGEARALFLVAGVAAPLAPEARNALRKLVRALPEPLRQGAERAASAMVLDPTRWGDTAEAGTQEGNAGALHLRALQQAIVEDRQVDLGYADRAGRVTERRVSPLGLVQKGLAWYLVAGTERGLRTFRVERVRSVEMTTDPTVRPPDFDLAEAWKAQAAAVEERRGIAHATVELRAGVLEPFRLAFGRHVEIVEQRPDGSARAIVAAATPTMVAERLAGWGAMVEVIDAPAVRAELRRIARELAARYEDPVMPVEAAPGEPAD